jgi:hypothetical protein
MPFTPGQRVRASDLNRLGQLVGRNQRTTNSTLSAAIVRVLSVIAPVKAGRTYRIVCDGEVYSDTGAATSQHELRYTTNNTEPTTGSTVIGRAIVRHDSTTGTPDQCHIEGLFVCTVDATLRVAVTTTRVVGAVNVAWTAAPTFPMQLMIEDIGDTISTTGTVY